MMTLKTKNENIIIQYKSIVQAILREINIRNISIPDFCEDMLIDVDEFIDSLSDIKSDFSYYFEILEALKNY